VGRDSVGGHRDLTADGFTVKWGGPEQQTPWPRQRWSGTARRAGAEGATITLIGLEREGHSVVDQVQRYAGRRRRRAQAGTWFPNRPEGQERTPRGAR